MPDHPFPRETIADVAGDSGVREGDLDDALGQIQEAIRRSDDGYEFSVEYTFGWRDEAAYYCYADGVWSSLRDRLSLDPDLVDAARAVHRRTMAASAEDRGESETFREQMDDDLEPLVVTDTAEGPPRTGQGFSV